MEDISENNIEDLKEKYIDELWNINDTAYDMVLDYHKDVQSEMEKQGERLTISEYSSEREISKRYAYSSWNFMNDVDMYLEFYNLEKNMELEKDMLIIRGRRNKIAQNLVQKIEQEIESLDKNNDKTKDKRLVQLINRYTKTLKIGVEFFETDFDFEFNSNEEE